MKASDIAKYGLMLALALVLSYVEALIPFVFPVPGMKVGLANIVILTMLYIAGLSSMVGHIFPVVWKFKGGKGISSMMGIFLAANPVATLIVLAIGIVIWAIFEYGSVVSFICISSLSVIEGIRIREILNTTDRKIVCLILYSIFLFTWYAHRKNIERLLLGKENKAHLIKKTKKKLQSKKQGQYKERL